MSAVPKGWKRKTIGSVCQLINGRAFKPTDWMADGLPIVRIQNLNDPTASFNYYDGQVRSRFLIDSGALLFAWSGTPGTSFGAHVWNGGPAILNQHIFNVLFDGSVVDRDFLKWAINHQLDELIDKAHGGVGLRHVTKGKIEDTEIDIPPLTEQRRLVAQIEGLSARGAGARFELKRARRLIARYKQALLEAAFRGDLTEEWRIAKNESRSRAAKQIETVPARAKPPRVIAWKPKIDLPDGWSWGSIDQLAGLVQYGSSAKTSESDADGIPVLRMGNIVDGRLDYGNLKYLPQSHHEFPELLLVDGDILFNRTNSADLVGKTAVYTERNEPTSFASYLIRLRVKGYVPELLSAYINSPYGRAWVRSAINQQVGQANVNGSKLRELGVPLIPFDEQQALWKVIKARFAAMDKALGEVDRAGRLLDRLDDAILDRAFRGELFSRASEASQGQVS